MMKASMRTISPVFTRTAWSANTPRRCTCRRREWRELREEHFAPARRQAAWRTRLRERWHNLRIESVSAELPREIVVGQNLPSSPRSTSLCLAGGHLRRAVLRRGLRPRPDHRGAGRAMRPQEGQRQRPVRLHRRDPCSHSGQHGYAVRSCRRTRTRRPLQPRPGAVGVTQASGSATQRSFAAASVRGVSPRHAERSEGIWAGGPSSRQRGWGLDDDSRACGFHHRAPPSAHADGWAPGP